MLFKYFFCGFEGKYLLSPRYSGRFYCLYYRITDLKCCCFFLILEVSKTCVPFSTSLSSRNYDLNQAKPKSSIEAWEIGVQGGRKCQRWSKWYPGISALFYHLGLHQVNLFLWRCLEQLHLFYLFSLKGSEMSQQKNLLGWKIETWNRQYPWTICSAIRVAFSFLTALHL